MEQNAESKPPAVSVVIACFNEEENIESCIKGVAEALPDAEILVVHGGTDGTLDKALAMTQEIPLLRAIRNENDLGKGHAIREGMKHARGSVVAQFDADLQFSAADLPALINPVLHDECDVCLGSRFFPGVEHEDYKAMPIRDFGNYLLSLFISTLIGRRVSDVTAGMKCWTRKAFEQIAFRDNTYSYEAEIVVRAGVQGLRIKEIPVAYASRTAGTSMHKHGWAVAKAGAVIIARSLICRLRGA
ncbi:MAG: glycosyltransferase family 2 protein [Verrucomicrobia bacterium]|nr:glycosyltransferase family 2 protein [Verrucomicrobiota bacterium]